MERGLRDRALARLGALLNLPSTKAPIPSFALRHAMEHHVLGEEVTLNAPTPAVTALEAEAARAEEDVRLAKLGSKPDLNGDAASGFRPRQKDGFSVVGRIELPIRKATTTEPRLGGAI